MNGIELARECGLTYRKVDHWTTRGVLQPARANPGSGHQRLYDPEEARVARAVRDLRDLGAGLDVLAEVAAQLRELPEHEWHGLVFINELGMLHRAGTGRGWAIDLESCAVGC